MKNLPLDRPTPDRAHFLDVLMGRAAGRPPLVEYLIDEAVLKPVLTDLLGRPWAAPGPDRETQTAYLDNFIDFWLRLGYDTVRFEQGLPFPEAKMEAPDSTTTAGTRSWADEHGGAIRTQADFERYAWPRVEDFDFFPFEYLSRNLPEGMGLMASHAGGVFEHLSWIMSLEGLSLALADDPGLVEAVAAAIGARVERFTAHLLDLPNLVAVFPGDDMGFRTGTLVSPNVLRRIVLPWHQRIAATAHRRGVPYFLHSCGNIDGVMNDLVDFVAIDGKHSFEDAVLPAEDFQARWGGQIAVLGGVDLDILSQGTETDVRRRTRQLIETCGGRGRFAIGSGNSIASYVPPRNYLAMVDEALAVTA